MSNNETSAVAKPDDIVIPSEDRPEAGMKPRPLLVLTCPDFGESNQVSTALIQTEKEHLLGGLECWVRLPKGTAELEEESFLIPVIVRYRHSALRSLLPLPQAMREKFSTVVRTLLLGIEESSVTRLSADLPPHDLREHRHRKKDNPFRILKNSGWRPQSRCEVLSVPDWHDLQGQKFIVISHDEFNHRYIYPLVLVVPLYQMDNNQEGVEQSIRGGHLILANTAGLKGRWVAFHELTRILDFSSAYLSPCPNCYKPPYRLHRWYCDSGPNAGKCARCNRIQIEWPTRTGAISNKVANTLAELAANYLRCGAQNPQMAVSGVLP